MSLLSPEMIVLLTSAASIAFVHTMMGPDHYLPFVAMAVARRWTWSRVLLITLACGAGHVLGSVLLGMLGILAQAQLGDLVAFEGWRGDLAAWLLFSFGLVYLAWGIRYAGRHEVHRHSSAHPQWIIFIVFILGPCEPLIPVLMYPAAKASVTGVLLVTGVFGAVTLLTMLAAVALSYHGMRKLHFPGLSRYGHAMAGATISVCGASILFLGV
jgi:nickel/cobalt transporter (NicO) family protein